MTDTVEKPLARLDGGDFDPHVPLGVAVHAKLKEAILEGKLLPGLPLSENALAQQLAVSRTPVREAIRALIQERLVSVLPGRRTIVSVPGAGEIDEIYELRRILETAAIERITSRSPVMKNLESVVKQSKVAIKERDLAQLGRLDADFHTAVISGLANATVQKLLDSVRDPMFRYRQRLLHDFTFIRAAMAEHEEMLQMLKDDRPRQAATLMTQHLANANAVIKVLFDSAPARSGS